MGQEHVRDLREAVPTERRLSGQRSWRQRLRRDGRASDELVAVLDGVTIRRSRAADQEALRRLAQLDSRRLAGGELLVAEVGGELRAALPLAGGAAIADPFRPTAPLVSLLTLRADQIREADAARQNSPAANGTVRAARSATAGR